MINIIVNGAKGKMGQEAIRAINAAADMTLVAETDSHDDLKSIIQKTKPDVVIDFTHPEVVKKNSLIILNAGSHAVIGTTGLSESDLSELDTAAKANQRAIIVCPNFAIGAVLMMHYAAKIAHFMPHVEIIELHHNKKADAPSGTAIKTAELIAKSNPNINTEPMVEKSIINGVRGGKKNNIPIHSVRLPGFIASEEVIFGGTGQTLKLRHDTISRECFMPGVLLATRKAPSCQGLVYGLEHLLEL